MDEIEITDDAKVLLREKQTELVRLIEAFVGLESSEEWATVKELVFSRSLVTIEREILIEATNPKVNTDKLYYLQGELAWARQYTDTNRYISTLKKQLEAIKNKLK